MTIVDYASNFWGDKHIGYSVLYENMKKGEESVQELLNFLKERITMEEDLFKSLGKSLHRVNGYVLNSGGFVDAWKLAKGTLELWTEIQSTMLRNLNELFKDVTRYQDELGRMRKRAKDTEMLETINLMQTTTTCLQKARETYNQRCAEVINLKQNNKEWTVASTKEYLKARNKLNKAHEEYRQYSDKYSQIRDVFEERIVRAARAFQEHDRLHLLQMKRFFAQLAKYLEDGHSAQAQVCMDLHQSVERHFDVEEVMLKFIEEKGTGTEPPQKLTWTEADELPPELDVVSCVQSQSSSNSSAIIPNPGPAQPPTVNDLLGLDDTWMTAGGAGAANSSGSFGFGGSGGSIRVRGSGTGSSDQNKSGDSDSERQSEALFPIVTSISAAPSTAAPVATTSSSSSSHLPQQISSWLGRQKLSGPWRLKKHFSASQSSLPGATAGNGGGESGGGTETAGGGTATATTKNFSKSYNYETASSSKGLFKRYQQKGKAMKSSVSDLTQIGKSQPELTSSSSNLFAVDCPELKVRDPLQEFGPPPPLPTTEPPSLEEELVAAWRGGQHQQPPIRHHSVSFASSGGADVDRQQQQPQHNRWSSSSSSSSSDEEEAALAAQRSKIRQLQIRPLSDSQQSSAAKLNASVDELRTAIGQISLQKSNTFENDPWANGPGPIEGRSTYSGFSSGVHHHHQGTMRAALTGDEHLRRKFTNDLDVPPFLDFTQSATAAPFPAGSSIARARPRSHTPLPPKPYATMPAASFTSAITEEVPTKQNNDPVAPTAPRPVPVPPAQPPIASGASSSSFGSPSLLSAISSSPLTVPPSTSSLSNIVVSNSKIPVAMAINEYFHVWIKRDTAAGRPEVRLFGTVMFSLSSSSLPQLHSSPFRFMLQGAGQLKLIVPNKMFFNDAVTSTAFSQQDQHEFEVDRDKMVGFLQERVHNCPQASFHNADLLRYELPPELAPSPLPLTFASRWTRLLGADGTVELCIDYESAPFGTTRCRDVSFNTKITTTSGDCLGISVLRSEPPAKWIAEQSVLSWEFRELPTGGHLKAVFKCLEELNPANTYVQFQLPDVTVSGAQLQLDDPSGYALSVFRQKVLTGKYFCEPIVESQN